MAKYVADAAMDLALAKIATCTHLNFCTTQPANYAAIAGVSKANVTLTAGAGNGDYTVADGDTSGRKLTVAEQTGIVPTADGDVTYAVLDDGTTLLAAVLITTKTVATTETWTSPAFDVWEIKDPA